MDSSIDSNGAGETGYGYRAPQVCKVVGITYRQLDYWARTDLLTPSLRTAEGSGSQRLYSFIDLVRLRVIKRLLDTGISLSKIRQAVEWLRSEMQSDQPLKDFTLLSDGIDIWISDNSNATQKYLMDTLRRGQGVFAIAVGQVQRDLEGEAMQLFPARVPPAEPITSTEAEST